MPDDPIIKAASDENEKRRLRMISVQVDMRTGELMHEVADELTRLRHEITGIRQLLEELLAGMRQRSA